MQQVKENDRVTVHYQGSLANGEIFESSSDSGPLSFKVGSGAALPTFERAVIGMKAGETRAISIGPEEGYGPRYEELEIRVKRENLGREGELQPGMVVAMDLEKEGQTHRLPAMVVELDEEYATVDFNHPLAGQELFYSITVAKIEAAEE